MLQKHELFLQMRDVLAKLYLDQESAMRVAKDAGLDLRLIPLSTLAINNWSAILDEAEKRDLVSALLDIAVNESQKNQELLNIRSAYQCWIEAGRPDADIAPTPAWPGPPVQPWPGMPTSDPQAFAAVLQTFLPAMAQPGAPWSSPEMMMRQLHQPLPRMTDLFEIIRDPNEVPQAIFRRGTGGWLAPYEVPHVRAREGTDDIQKAIKGALLDAGGVLLVQSRAGLGKTREVSELAAQVCCRGWTVCVAKSEGDKALNRLAIFPEDLFNNRLLLILDDLHRRVGSSTEGQAPYAERLEAFIAYIDAQMTPGTWHVLATARTEPHHQKQLGFDPVHAPWNRFRVYELPEFTPDGLEHMLIELAERVQVTVDQGDVASMVSNSDHTLRTLFDNVNIAHMEKQPLTLERWLPSQGESWESRFREARGRFPDAEAVYEALHLVREAGLPTRLPYVAELGAELTQTNIRTAVEGLVDMGLLGLRRGMLDAFSDEQLADSLHVLGRSLPDVAGHWDAVVEAVMGVTDRPADWPADLVMLSERLKYAKLYEQAIKVADTAIDQRPDYAAAYAARGSAQDGLGDLAEAERDYTTAIEFGRDDGMVYLFRALVRFRLGNRGGVDADLWAAIKHSMGDSTIHMLVAVIRFVLELDLEAAEAAFTDAISYGHDDTSVYFFRGSVRKRLGDNEGAEADYTAAMERGKDDAMVYIERGKARGAAGNWSGAEADFTAAIERGEDDADVYYWRGMVRVAMSGDYEAAEEDYTAAIERGKDDADVYHKRGEARRMLSDYTGAEADYTTIIEFDRDNAKAYYGRGMVRAMSGDYEAAEEDYTAAIERGKDDADVYYWRGIVRVAMSGDYEAAEEDYTAAIERGKDDANVYFRRGEVRRVLGDYTGAETDCAAAIKRAPNNPEAHSELGLVLRLSGRWQEAGDAYRHAVTLDPSRYLGWMGLAACARHAGDEASWKEAIEQARPLVDTEDLYNAACFASVAGEVDRALDLLQQALKEQPDQAGWAKEDPDLYWIQDDPLFQQIVEVAANA